jgi:hypothetical protein
MADTPFDLLTNHKNMTGSPTSIAKEVEELGVEISNEQAAPFGSLTNNKSMEDAMQV